MRVALVAAILALCLGGCITKAVQEKQLSEAGPKTMHTVRASEQNLTLPPTRNAGWS